MSLLQDGWKMQKVFYMTKNTWSKISNSFQADFRRITR